MRKMFLALAATAALGGLSLPASAAPTQQAAPLSDLVAAVQNGEVKSDYVQYRRYYRGGPRYVERRYYRGGPRYVERRYYRRDRGNTLAAGALGLATGAIIGGAIANSQAQAAPAPAYGGSAEAYCAQRFRSYDPASGTYMGYDGVRRSCP